MHYVGVDMEIRLERASGGTECLAKVPRYSFFWQRLYSFDAPFGELPKIANGDTLGLKCFYNNTRANENVARALDEQDLREPVDVLLGGDTLDEMCFAFVGLIAN